MRKIVLAAALLGATAALAQQPSVIEQVDNAISVERMAGNTALGIKDQRIAELQKALDAARKEAEACKKPVPEAAKK